MRGFCCLTTARFGNGTGFSNRTALTGWLASTTCLRTDGGAAGAAEGAETLPRTTRVVGDRAEVGRRLREPLRADCASSPAVGPVGAGWGWNTANRKRCRRSWTRRNSRPSSRPLLNGLPANEAVVFADAVRPTHGRWDTTACGHVDDRLRRPATLSPCLRPRPETWGKARLRPHAHRPHSNNQKYIDLRKRRGYSPSRRYPLYG